ncbi:glutathione S-transferase family protein [Thalassomonas actiniarum]|uniref:Glutathione S-transferase C-terminal domain-containing protein n=1 Tax=Thalassomonas actiniarum TaxID=485447 RepID=A0AAE9YNF6_9GAMM|nr:glutathione binding-like protein [Thalassomonas actiniarum]WDD96581.1 glutathione S-transferase C-terminal domain-containing protein [Thalassomonas actiniarum]
MYKLYYAPDACSLAIHISLEELNADFKPLRVNIGEEVSPELLEVNPLATVPVLIDDDLILTEGVAILNYLADHFPTSSLRPETGKARGEFYQWMNILSAGLHRSYCRAFAPGAYVKSEPAADEVYEVADEEIQEMFIFIDKHLASRSYLLGEQVSFIDFYLFAMLGWTDALSCPLSSYENLSAFYERIRVRPAVQRAYATENE